ncbi:MAG: hypothetical protein JJU00_10795 [Opitutales bacterium]|nr:hypothetical protein [Opitutales bacterium]
MNEDTPALHNKSADLLSQRDLLRGQLSKLAEEWRDDWLCIEAQVYLRDLN